MLRTIRATALLLVACGKVSDEHAAAGPNSAGSGAMANDSGAVELGEADSGVSEPSANCTRVEIEDPELLRNVRRRLSLSAADELTPARLLQLTWLTVRESGEPPVVSL